MRAPTHVLLTDLAKQLGSVDWLEQDGWRVTTVRHYEEVATYLAGRVYSSAVGWVEDSDVAGLQFTSRRVGPVFLPIEEDEYLPVRPLTGRTSSVSGIEHVRRWCVAVGLPELQEERLNEVLGRYELFAEDKLEAAAEALGLPPAP